MDCLLHAVHDMPSIPGDADKWKVHSLILKEWLRRQGLRLVEDARPEDQFQTVGKGGNHPVIRLDGQGGLIKKGRPRSAAWGRELFFLSPSIPK